MAKRQTGRGIIIHDGKIILMERWRDGLHYYSIPGGGLEDGETAEAAVVREIREELGLDTELERKVYEMHTEDMIHHIFLCSYKGGEPTLQSDAPEAEVHAKGENRFKPGWVSLDDIATIPLLYWEPLREHLQRDAQDGFDVDTKTITAR